MKKALQILALLLAAALFAAAAAAQENMDLHAEGLIAIAPVEGVQKRPADLHQASFALHYQFPQFEAANAADEMINEYYRALAADMAQTIPAEDWEEASITCEVTHNSKRYLSVVQTLTAQSGNGQRETLSADTFARDGVYAGQPLSLSQVLGLEEGNELSVNLSMAETLAYDLVWQLVEQEMSSADSDYPEGLTIENLQSVFMPETDFYLDADGNVVFFIQAGELAGEIAGVLRFPFAAAELLGSIHE